MGEANKTNNYTDFFYKAFRNILLVSIPLVIISALILGFILHSSADTTTVDNVSFDLKVSCTISSNVTSAHTAEINGGQHKTEVGETKVSTYCNDNNGYNIYAIGSSNNTDGNTDLVVNGLSSDYNIKTGIYSSGSTISSWGMKLTAGTGTGAGGAEVTPPIINNGYDSYNAVPNVYTLVASRPSGTNMDMDANPDVTGSYFTTTYDIYASSVQPAGSYEGKVKYIMTHPNANAPSTINDIDAAFAINGKQKVYQDSEGSYYAMQDMTSDICNSVNRTGEATATQLVDIRDNNLYYVTKLEDGHCWTTQNLALNLSSTIALTSENTDLNHINNPNTNDYPEYSAGYANDNGIIKWTPSISTVSSVANWSGSSNNPRSLTSSGGYTDQSKGRHGLTGNYYNWSAAIASNNSQGLSTDNIAGENREASNSVCPKGWRLPQIRNYISHNISNNDFANLNFYYNDSKTDTAVGLMAAPLYFMRSGDVNGTALNAFGNYGYYWSSTVNNYTNAYDSYFTSSNVVLNAGGQRSRGFSVRCIAR